MHRWTYEAATALICICAVAPALAADSSFDRHFNVTPGGRLTLDTDLGSVVVVGRDGNDLDVHAALRGSADFLSRLHLTAVQDSQGVTVTGRMQGPGWLDQWLGFWFGFGRHDVTITIDVPRDYATDLHTAGGSLDVRHLDASVHGRTSGGSVTVDDVRGPVNMRTSGGSIEVSDCTGDLDVRASGGSIRLERIDGSIRAMTSGGSVKAEVRTNRGVSLQTSGGSISLSLPANATGSLDAHTDGGGVRSSIPLSSVEVASRDELRGAINGGGPQILLHTSGGSIRLAPLE